MMWYIVVVVVINIISLDMTLCTQWKQPGWKEPAKKVVSSINLITDVNNK